MSQKINMYQKLFMLMYVQTDLPNLKSSVQTGFRVNRQKRGESGGGRVADSYCRSMYIII